MKRIIILAVALVAAIAFILIPVKPSDLILRIKMEGSAPESTCLYYSTTDVDYFNEEMSVKVRKTATDNLWEIRIPSSEAERLEFIRLDFEGNGNHYIITDMAVYSAGIRVKDYRSSEVFSSDCLVAFNDLVYDVYDEGRTAYISAVGPDPFLVFSNDFGIELRNMISNYRLSRFFIVLFIAAAYLISKKRPFKTASAI